jgi:hypothetical protein
MNTEKTFHQSDLSPKRRTACKKSKKQTQDNIYNEKSLTNRCITLSSKNGANTNCAENLGKVWTGILIFGKFFS